STLTASSWHITPQKTGDLGTGISALDAAYVLQAASGLLTLTPQQQLACDVTGNGTVSALDASTILQYSVGLIPRFPVAQTCASDWLFEPTAAPAVNQVIVHPSMAPGSCQPGAIAFAPLTTSMSGRDFSAILFGDCTGNWMPSSTASLATSVTAFPSVRLGRRRVVGPAHHLRVPLEVRTTGTYRAVDVGLRYDPTRLTIVKVRRVGAAQGALLAVNRRVAGVLKIALASRTPLVTGAVLMLELDMHAKHTSRL